MSEKIDPTSDLDSYKFRSSNPDFVDCFIKNGFVILEEAFDKNLITYLYNFATTRYLENKSKFISKFPKKPLPVLGISNHILSQLKSLDLYEKIKKSDRFLNALGKILGPDIVIADPSSLWINDPDDTCLATKKSLHQEIWTGADTDDLLVWVPLHETEKENTMSVVPESHYFGFLPNQNRNLVCPDGFELPDSLALAPLKPGDVVLFHSLLLHETSGRGNNARYAISFLFKNTLAPTTSRHKAYAQIPLRTGPFTKIGIGLGNDYLSSLRTYGGNLSNNQNFDPADLDIEPETTGNLYQKLWQSIENKKTQPRYLNNVISTSYTEFCEKVFEQNPSFVKNIVESLYSGDVYILKQAFQKDYLQKLKYKLHQHSQNTPQSFHKMLDGCPDFHRVIDPILAKNYSLRAIKHSYYFFPWNSDPFNLFKIINEKWRVFKFLGGFSADAYEKNIPSTGVVDRLQIAQYASGVGELELHSDPYLNQKVGISVIMSKRGEDYKIGGTYILNSNKEKIDIENDLDVGDIYFAYPTVLHGVEVIDKGQEVNWNSLNGRWWMGLYSNDSDEYESRHTCHSVKENATDSL